eukprot:TRINITY_DN7_c0_g1_i3.p1 TRINITY_DN7_c0_g1~~TRINITY_DN7_c0_g1_i3.p1  ORF type:complete len:435 (+),score=-2.49 TRINITY_DN7_c0_g1_i3:384-1688(+)
MQVGTYPTRNFATLGPSQLRPPFTGASVASFTTPRSSQPSSLTYQHRAGVSLYTSTCVLAQTCVFNKQSPDPGHCGPPGQEWASLLPKLRDNFAEFLHDHSLERLGILIAPTCVSFSTGTFFVRARLFLTAILGTSGSQMPSPILGRPTTQAGSPLSQRHGSSTSESGAGMLTCCPSATPFGLALGSDQPWADLPSPGNLRLSANRILTCFLVTRSGIITCSRSTDRYRPASLQLQRSSTTHTQRCASAVSVSCLVPFIIGAELLDQQAITHFQNGGCFQANILAVLGAQLPFALSMTWGPQQAVWVVSLSTTKLIPRSLTAVADYQYSEFGSDGQAGSPPFRFSRSTPGNHLATLTLKLFRRERAISRFDDTFNPPHRSSPQFSTQVGSVLHEVVPSLQPAHASITWFRVCRPQPPNEWGTPYSDSLSLWLRT